MQCATASLLDVHDVAVAMLFHGHSFTASHLVGNSTFLTPWGWSRHDIGLSSNESGSRIRFGQGQVHGGLFRCVVAEARWHS